MRTANTALKERLLARLADGPATALDIHEIVGHWRSTVNPVFFGPDAVTKARRMGINLIVVSRGKWGRCSYALATESEDKQ